MDYMGNDNISHIGVGVVSGKCKGDLEAVIKSLDPKAEASLFPDGTVVYHFSNSRTTEPLSPNYGGAFKATAFTIKGSGMGCDGANVCIAVTSDSLTLLRKVIDTVIRQAQVEVISYNPNVLDLNSDAGSKAQAPSNFVSAPGVFLN